MDTTAGVSDIPAYEPFLMYVGDTPVTDASSATAKTTTTTETTTSGLLAPPASTPRTSSVPTSGAAAATAIHARSRVHFRRARALCGRGATACAAHLRRTCEQQAATRADAATRDALLAATGDAPYDRRDSIAYDCHSIAGAATLLLRSTRFPEDHLRRAGMAALVDLCLVMCAANDERVARVATGERVPGHVVLNALDAAGRNAYNSLVSRAETSLSSPRPASASSSSSSSSFLSEPISGATETPSAVSATSESAALRCCDAQESMESIVSHARLASAAGQLLEIAQGDYWSMGRKAFAALCELCVTLRRAFELDSMAEYAAVVARMADVARTFEETPADADSLASAAVASSSATSAAVASTSTPAF